MNKILAHHRGLLTGCKILEEKDSKVKVQVIDEKRPKWIDLSLGKQKLFDNLNEAIAWIEEMSNE